MVTELVPDRPGSSDPGRGRRLAIDVGSVRVGVASCDPDGIMATPVETVARSSKTHTDSDDVRRVVELANEYEAVEIVVGLPRTLRGESGAAAKLAVRFARVLQRSLPSVPIRLSDERLTTVSAARGLRDSGVSARNQRSMIDQAAAVTILQGWLDERRRVLAQDVSDVVASADSASEGGATVPEDSIGRPGSTP